MLELLDSQSLSSSLPFFIRHSLRDIGRRKFHYSLAFCSVFIVVLSTLVINTVVEKGPIIFLRLAEQSHGEIDGFLLPYGEYKNEHGNSHVFLNYTRVSELYGEKTYNIAPRKYMHSLEMTMDHDTDLYTPDQRTQWE